MVASPLLAILSLATGIGLWRGHKWAWWLATFYYFQFVVGGVFVLALVPIAYYFLDRPVTERSLELVLKHAARISFFWFLTWYMTKINVLDYFNFQRFNRLRALSILSGCILAMAVLVGVMTFVALSLGARFR